MAEKIKVDRLWHKARLATLDPARGGLGLVENGYVGSLDGRIVTIGSGAPPIDVDPGEAIDCGGRLITPGLIDCHTHLVYAGDRADEFERRLQGASYTDIAAGGGGILSTVRATRAAQEADLVAASLLRLRALTDEGVTTVEIKSGYGLDLASERRMLRAARTLGRTQPVRVVTSFLGAHALPPEALGDREGYIDHLCADVLPTLARETLADAVDAFCETIAFSPRQCDRLFDVAAALGLRVKLHADQLTNGGGAALAARHGALSADHLEYADEAGVAAMARAGTVAVLLPGAFYVLRETQAPPVALFRRHGVAMALASDCNPGSSPLTSLLLAMNMGATLFRLTVEECLAATTRVAAQALGLGRETGTIETGKSCDLAVWNVERPAELVYRIGYNPLQARVWRGW